jgi:hypothetical protein
MHNNPKSMGEIRHFLHELRRIEAKIPAAVGPEAHEKLLREWRELSDSLHSRLKAARVFRRDWLFVKYIDQQRVEVVLTPHAISIEPLNGCWLDVIYDSQVCESADYADAITQVLENQEVFHG